MTLCFRGRDTYCTNNTRNGWIRLKYLQARERREEQQEKRENTSNQSTSYFTRVSRIHLRANASNCKQFGCCKRLWQPHTSSPALHRQARETRRITPDLTFFPLFNPQAIQHGRQPLLPTIARRCSSSELDECIVARTTEFLAVVRRVSRYFLRRLDFAWGSIFWWHQGLELCY